MTVQPYDADSTPELDILAASPLFSRLDRAARAEIADDLSTVTLGAGQTLFHQGDSGDSMYIVDRGLLEVWTQAEDGTRIVLDRLDPGSSVGEMALLTGRPRTADVVAVVDSRLVRISKIGFDRLAERHPAIASGFALAVTPRVHRLHLAGILRRLLGDLDPASLHAFQDKLVWRRLAEGEWLFRQGEIGSSMYIVVTGRLQVIAESGVEDMGERILNEIGAGDTIGEFALLTDDVRSAGVYALRQADLVEMTRPVFEELIRDHPQALLEIARMIADRQKQSNRIGREERTEALTFAVYPAGENSSAVAPFARRLLDYLSAYGPTLLLTSTGFDEAFGRSGMAQMELDDPLSIITNNWLQEQGRVYRHILFVADTTWTNWSRRCLAHGDHILLVGLAGADPAPGRMEEACNPRARQELVLLHPPQTSRPVGTLAWLASRPIVAHHHVRDDEPADWARLARRLTGRTVGAVFSGGAARGLAHIGVIRALEEAGQAVDSIAGTSMGAFIGAGWALGITPDEGVEMAQRMANPDYLLDRTFPYTAVMASRKLTNAMHEIFGDATIEDLWRPFFCVSTNLSTATPVIHDRGPLWRAVRASISLPGIFSPILNDNNELLVDGGVMNNFPVDLMAARDTFGLIIGSNVSPHREKPYPHTFGESVSGWQVLRSRLNPFGQTIQVPSLVGTMLRTVEVNSLYRRKLAEKFVDLLIEPNVSEYRFLDFDSFQEMIRRGYEAGREALARHA